MKRFIFCLVGLLLSHLSWSQLSVSLPINNAVYQRNTANNATIWIAGQLVTNSSTPTTIEWRLLRISPISAAFQNDVTSWAPYQTQSYGVFRFSYPNLLGGWYQLEVRGTINGNQQLSVVRFGVGEVFVSAGQSNAQGVDNISEYHNRYCYAGVVAINYRYDQCVNDFPIYPNMNNIPTFSNNQEAINISIAPQGVSPWYYTAMGNKLVELLGVPIAFFNAAQGATALDNWEQSSQGYATYYWCNNTRNVCSNNTGSDNAFHVGQPYSILRRTVVT